MPKLKVVHNGKFLEWPHIWDYLKLVKGKRDKWIVSEHTPKEVEHFLELFGMTTIGQPNSLGEGKEFVGLNNSQVATICLHKGFAIYLCKHLPEIAIACGIAEEAK